MGAQLGNASLIDGNINAMFESLTEDSQYFSREEMIRLPMLYERTHRFPWYFCDFFAILFDFLIDVEARDQYRTSPPQHSHATSCAPHARLAPPHVGSASAPSRTAGTAVPWNTRAPATCLVRCRWTSGTAFRLDPVPPRTCRSRPSH